MKTIIHMADYSGPYFGNFIASLLKLQETVIKELNFRTIFVFSKIAENRFWLNLIQERDVPVLLHSHFTAFDIDAAIAAKYLNAKVVWHVHSDLVGRYTIRQQIKDLAKMRIISKMCVNRIISVSDSVARFEVRRGAPLSKISTIYIYKENKKSRAVLRQSCSISESEKVFLLFGWDPKTKGVDLLATAAAMLKKAGYSNVLFLIMSGERTKDIVLSMVSEAPNVKVIPPVENVSKLYMMADCFVSASRSEAFSYSIGEAMAMVLPVISSDLPHLLAIYGPAGEGFLPFKSEDVQDLAKTLIRIVELLSEELNRLGELNKRFIEKNLTVEKWSENVVNLYKLLLNPTEKM